MIMPCMNATSAFERGGSVACVSEGSVLLGLPGAPGWTTTGDSDALWCANAVATRPKLAIIIAASAHKGVAASFAETRRARLQSQSLSSINPRAPIPSGIHPETHPNRDNALHIICVDFSSITQ